MSLNRRRWSNKFLESMRNFLKQEEKEEEREEEVAVIGIPNASGSNDKEVLSADSSSSMDYVDVKSTLSSSNNNNLRSLESQNSSENDLEFSLASNKFEGEIEGDNGIPNFDYSDATGKTPNNQINESANKSLNLSNATASRVIPTLNTSSDTSIKGQSNETAKHISKTRLSRQQQQQQQQQYFSSPELQISEIAQPDIWDALVALEQALSPFDKSDRSAEEREQSVPVLSRLSEKFKGTPGQFTEKLVSLIEDSVLSSSESPASKPVQLDDASGISLNRMTGEFRKLCKFIEDESMPEWAPSLMNATQTNDTSQIYSRNTLRRINDAEVCVTPINKIKSNVDSPIKRFTPSADKSFEYWEKFCNIMCENQSSGKKRSMAIHRRSLSVPESMKQNLNEMLTICERQMASLDDSAIDVNRNSEPCKATDNELVKDVAQTPRSKSESRICSAYEKFCPTTATNDECDRVDDSLTDEDDFSEIKERSSERKSGFSNCGESFDETYQDDQDDQDCSLLLEMAKRRQRCLNTAKLMMEIDRSDPDASGDNRCLETLYKLGVQDETFIEDESNVKFLNTLEHCLEYKRYFQDNSKQLLDALQNLNTPGDLQTKRLAEQRKFGTPVSNRLQNQRDKQGLSVKRKVPVARHVEPRTGLTTKTYSTKISQKLENKATVRSEKKAIGQVTSRAAPTFKRNNNFQPLLQKQHHRQLDEKTLLVTTKPRDLSEKALEVRSADTPSPEKFEEKEIIMPEATPKTPNDSSPVDAELGASKLEARENVQIPESSPKSRFFVTPGKSPAASSILGRKKPTSYFSDIVSKKAAGANFDFDGVKSPINMYIHGTDADLIQNVKGRTEDFLLTPVRNQEQGKSPRKLKMKLSPSTENKSPYTNSNENKISMVRYQSANKVHMIDDKLSYSPCSLTPNSRTKKLLEPIENTVIIRHEGRIIEYNQKSDQMNSETSIRVQKMAEKTATIRKK